MRHGQPVVNLESIKRDRLSPRCLGKVVDEYESTGLNLGKTPPGESMKMASDCKVVISSDLPRALDSIQMLGVEKKASSDPCFRESSLPYLNWEKPHFSVFTWCIIFRIAWLFGFATNGEPIKLAKQRANIGFAKLHDLAHSNDSVLLLGHGIMNRLVAKEMKAQGWVKKETTGEGYWSYTVFKLTTQQSTP